MIRKIIIVLIAFPASAWAMDKDAETRGALEIARDYGLTRNQAIMLLAIKDHEAGTPAKKEFGVENVEIIDDPIRRFFNHGCRSASLIKRFCPDTRSETIKRFNHGYGKGKRRYPGYATDPTWWVYVKRRMRDYRDIAY